MRFKYLTKNLKNSEFFNAQNTLKFESRMMDQIYDSFAVSLVQLIFKEKKKKTKIVHSNSFQLGKKPKFNTSIQFEINR